ncbi:MAG TPA: 50S ribosomal protein L11 methyltransferase [Solirubrobacteraceae bacterium]|nr:50S ribosomal protein L11 methyltransferase [Solirubrobacteraceae bacterium]
MIRLALRVRREDAELVLAELLELAPSGVEEVSLGESVEYAVYGAPGELPSLPDLKAAAGAALVDISTTETADDWQERWRRFHEPVLIQAPHLAAGPERRVPALYVRPPWEPPAAGREGELEQIVIEPGQAFGTGAHATTRQCLELLLLVAHEDPRLGALVDLGTGSGVLAIAAARLGFQPVVAVDSDRESIAAASANAAANGVRLELRRADVSSYVSSWGEASLDWKPPVVLANLLRPALLELAHAMPAAPRHLLAGGLLAAQADEVAGAFERLGLRERDRREGGEWVALWLSVP